MALERYVGQMNEKYALDKKFYDKINSNKNNHKLIEKYEVPRNRGKGFIVRKGQVIKIIEAGGPQISDVTFWNADNPKELFDAERTIQLEGWFITKYSRIWSRHPWFRPMATCLEDTVVTSEPEKGYHHHWVGSHCAPEIYELRAGKAGLNACHLMFLEAIEPFGLKEEDILHNVNIHQKGRIDPFTGRVFCPASDAKKGDHIDFYAEIDLLVAVTVCPNGDGIKDGTDPEDVDIWPIGVEIYDTGTVPKEFYGWTNWRTNWKGRWTPEGK